MAPMSDFYIKGVLDRFGGIEWILFRAGDGLARPLTVLGDYQIVQLQDQMKEQRPALDALRLKARRKAR